MTGLIEQMRTYFRGLQPGQRILIVAAVAISALALVAVGWWSWAAQYEVVYSSSNPGEVEDVAKALEEQGIPFRIAESGRAVEVLDEDLGRARIAAASSGKILGFEVLDNIELGTSPQRERWAYQRALQGELQKTIGSLEEVEWSRVHLVLPERSAFLRDEQPPSASVTVKLRPGAALAGAEVRGITALVAGAVDGLKPGDVVLVNQDGALLAGGGASDAQADGTSVLGPSLLALRGAEEQRTRNAIRDALVKVLGSPDDITVGVTVEVESAVVDQLTRSKDPDSQVLISEVIHEQAGETTKPTGIPGTASNLPEQGGTQNPTAGATATSKETEQEQRSNYDYTTVEKREQQGPGDIKRISVAVVVNSDRLTSLATALATSAAAGAAAPDAAAIQAQVDVLKKQIEETVRSAAGFSKERGDAAVVTFLPFSANADVGATELSDSSLTDAANRWIPYVVILIALVMLFLFVVRPLVEAVTRASGPASIGALDANGRLIAGPNGGADDPNRQVSKGLSDRLRSMVDNFETVDAADLNRLVDLEQDATAQVLRRWIRES